MLTPGHGVAATRWVAPRQGLATVRLAGSAGDWDLALFDPATGKRHDASASFGSTEQALAWVSAGEELVVQACRRLGEDPSVDVSVDLHPMATPGPDERISMVSVPVARQDDVDRLEALGLDVTHDRTATSVTLALYSERERGLLAAAGFRHTTLIPDLVAADRADRVAEADYARRVGRSPLPSGRTTYRAVADFGTDLKQLAEQNPALVRKGTLPLPSLENRPIEGIEIAKDVHRTDDGRPVYVAMGLVHAREWPGGELTMEFAIDLVRGFGSDPRITALLERVRVYILPVMNPDGFAVSRGAGPTPADDDANATLGLIATDQSAYKRKNCRPTTPGSQAQPCAARTGAGVDLNRNFGAYWGGAGSSTDVAAQNYRGTAPYSEPESEAFHQFSQRLQVTEVITSHTFTRQGTWLRQPGFDVADDAVPRTVPDEAGMRELGDAMRGATGYLSQLGWKLGNITGATEDWNYFAQGGFGYTPEIRGSNFHMNYADAVIGEYEGEVVQPSGSDSTPDDESHDAVLEGDFRGKGFREALLLSAEQAGNARDHSVLEGTAPPGLTLRLKKSFVTPTSQPGVVVPDTLDTTVTVPASGRYEWHVNPSTRPLAAAKESWTLTCEDRAGTVLEGRDVIVDRGQRLRIDLHCGASPGGAGAGADRPAAGGGRCLGRSLRVVSRGIGSLRIGHTRARVLERSGAPAQRPRGSFRYCVTGGGAVLVAFSRRGDARLVASTARGHRARGIGPRTSLRALRRRYPRGRRIAGNLVLTSRSTRIVFGLRRGRVRFVAVADRRLIKSTRQLRAQLGLLRL